MNAFSESELQKITDAYLDAVLWTEYLFPESEEEEPEPLSDTGFTIFDFSDRARAKALADCEDFCNGNTGITAALLRQSGLSLDMIGTNFLLTRNRQGAGFWDAGLPDEIGDALTDAAHCYSEDATYMVYQNANGDLEFNCY